MLEYRKILIYAWITDNFDLCLDNGKCPEILKLVKVTPIYNKATAFEKGNFRPIYILSNISETYGRIILNQCWFFYKWTLYQCDFAKLMYDVP